MNRRSLAQAAIAAVSGLFWTRKLSANTEGFMDMESALRELHKTPAANQSGYSIKLSSGMGETVHYLPEVEDWNHAPDLTDYVKVSREVEVVVDNDEEIAVRSITEYRHINAVESSRGRERGMKYSSIIYIKKKLA